MIGYYVDHHGEGHRNRALAIAARAHEPVTILSSVERPGNWHGDWIDLPLDSDADIGHTASEGRVPAERPDADGAFHWLPIGHAGLSRRMATVAAWLDSQRPTVLVADDSVEIAVLSRLMGVRVVVMAMPGDRTDAAHQLAYRVASTIIAPWPEWARPAEGLDKWRSKLAAVGAISRYEDRPRRPREGAETGVARSRSRDILLIEGAGTPGTELEQVKEAMAATRGWRWQILSPSSGRWDPDPWPQLNEADVVVCHCGQSLIAEVAAARRPAVIIPEPRPYGEQVSCARTLADQELAIVEPQWPSAESWPGLLEAAWMLGGKRWSRWSDGRAAKRAAALLDRIAMEGRGPVWRRRAGSRERG